MSAAKERKCVACGNVEMTASKAPMCLKCKAAEKSQKNRDNEKKVLQDLGYADVSYLGLNIHGKAKWKFTHTDCGTVQEWVYPNVMSMRKKNSSILPCSHCGGKRRMGIAMQAYVDKYGMTEEDMKRYSKYARRVRQLSDKNYVKHLNEINPHGYKRGMWDYHLDHIMPIIEGLNPPSWLGKRTCRC